MGVAVATGAALRDHGSFAVFHEVGDEFPVSQNAGTEGDFHDQVGAGATRRASAGAGATVFGDEFRIVAEIFQSVSIVVSLENYRATTATVATVRAAFRDIDFTAKRDGTVATFACFYIHFRLIDKHNTLL